MSELNVTILGCGNAFSFKNFHQSMMLEYRGETLVIDFGAYNLLALQNQGLNAGHVDGVYISHLHADHIGGLELLAFQRYDWINWPQHYSERKPELKAVKLYGVEELINEYWEKSARGGLESMQGFDSSLETFFEPIKVQAGGSFDWNGFTMYPIQQIHITTGTKFRQAWGLLVERKGFPTIYFTTDAQYDSPKQIRTFYEKADIIFQDCEFVGVDTVKKNSDFCSGVHANYAELAGYPSANATILKPEVKRKMFLSHYQDFVSINKDYKGQDIDWDKTIKEDGFGGKVHVGQVFTFKNNGKIHIKNALK